MLFFGNTSTARPALNNSSLYVDPKAKFGFAHCAGVLLTPPVHRISYQLPPAYRLNTPGSSNHAERPKALSYITGTFCSYSVTIPLCSLPTDNERRSLKIVIIQLNQTWSCSSGFTFNHRQTGRQHRYFRRSIIRFRTT